MDAIKFPFAGKVGRGRRANPFARKAAAPEMLVPAVPASAIVEYPVQISLIDLDRGNGNTSLLEQAVILSVAKALNAATVFEIGTFDGWSAANLALNLGSSAKIVTIDLPAQDIGAAKLPLGKYDIQYIMKEASGTKSRDMKNVVQLYGDSATYDFSPWFGQCDLVFVDACHEYEYVRNDSEIALKLVRPGGTILWHDYGTVFHGVARALNEFYRNDQRFRSLRHIQGTSLCVCRTDPPAA